MTKLIKNGTIVAADRSYEADILIEGETIAAIGKNLEAGEGQTQIIDAEGAFIMPGGIDPHTHFEMPFMGTKAAETWESGTLAAVSGGTTMVVDFVIPDERGLIVALDEWEERAHRQACCDYSFHASITGWNEQIFNDMAHIVRRGINSFKHFMAYKGALMVNDDEMFASFQRCRELGAMPFVHAENGDLVAALQQKYLHSAMFGPEAHAYSRPPDLEGEAVNRAITIADAAGVPIYIVHVSCDQAHEAIRRAQMKGIRVYGEPLIQHLTLDVREYDNPDWDYAAQRVMSPPFRDKKHQDSLWAGLQSGSLHVVATDHCAFTTSQKQMGRADFTKIPNGTGGVEDRLSVLWTYGVETGRLTPNEFVAITSTNIARILNIYPRKGAIVPGSDADLVIWDPKASKTITALKQMSIIDYNVFEGMVVKGVARTTLSRGAIVWGEGWRERDKSLSGRGKFIARPPFSSVAKALSQWKELTAPRPVVRSPDMMPIGV